MDLMQEKVDKILEWIEGWNIKINKDKNKTLVISSSNADTNWYVGLITENLKNESLRTATELARKVQK